MTSSPPSLEQLKSTIRGVGLRSTAPRIAVLRRLLVATTPISHGELVDTLAEEGMDRTTVYRNLVDLTEAGRCSERTWVITSGASSSNAAKARACATRILPASTAAPWPACLR